MGITRKVKKTKFLVVLLRLDFSRIGSHFPLDSVLGWRDFPATQILPSQNLVWAPPRGCSKLTTCSCVQISDVSQALGLLIPTLIPLACRDAEIFSLQEQYSFPVPHLSEKARDMGEAFQISAAGKQLPAHPLFSRDAEI